MVSVVKGGPPPTSVGTSLILILPLSVCDIWFTSVSTKKVMYSTRSEQVVQSMTIHYNIVTPDLSEVDKDKYKEKVQELANELDKEVPKIGTVKLLMKLTFPGRRSWNLEQQPTVADVLQVLKESLRVSIVLEEMKYLFICMHMKAPKGTDIDPQRGKRPRFPQGLARVAGKDSRIYQIGSSQATICTLSTTRNHSQMVCLLSDIAMYPPHPQPFHTPCSYF